MLDGIIPGGWEMDDIASENLEILSKGFETRHLREIDCVLFFFPFSAIASPEFIDQRNQMKDSFQLMLKKEYNPLLVLTMVDQVDSNVRNDPLGTYPQIQKNYRKSFNFFGCSRKKNNILCQLQKGRQKKFYD